MAEMAEFDFTEDDVGYDLEAEVEKAMDEEEEEEQEAVTGSGRAKDDRPRPSCSFLPAARSAQ